MSSIFKVLKAENHQIQATLDKLEDATAGEGERRAQLLGEIGTRVRRLDQVRERLYPVLAESEGSLAEQVAEARRMNDRVGQALRRAGQAEPPDPKFQPLVETLSGSYRQQVEHEEKELLPAAAGVLSEEQAEQLGNAVLAAQPDLEPGALAERAPGPRESLISD